MASNNYVISKHIAQVNKLTPRCHVVHVVVDILGQTVNELLVTELVLAPSVGLKDKVNEVNIREGVMPVIERRSKVKDAEPLSVV